MNFLIKIQCEIAFRIFWEASVKLKVVRRKEKLNTLLFPYFERTPARNFAITAANTCLFDLKTRSVVNLVNKMTLRGSVHLPLFALYLSVFSRLLSFQYLFGYTQVSAGKVRGKFYSKSAIVALGACYSVFSSEHILCQFNI